MSERGKHIAAGIGAGFGVVSMVATASLVGYDTARDKSCEAIPQSEIDYATDKLSNLFDTNHLDKVKANNLGYVAADGEERKMRIAESFGFTVHKADTEFNQILAADDINDIRDATDRLGKVYGFNLIIDNEADLNQTRDDTLLLTRRLHAYPVEVMQKVGPEEVHIGAKMEDGVAGLHLSGGFIFSRKYSDAILLGPKNAHAFDHEFGHAVHTAAR